MPRRQPTTRDDALLSALTALERQFGPGTVMRLGEAAVQDIAVIPTGALGLDLITGCGGYPRGRVVEIFGPESSGKTTLTLHAIASCQTSGGTAAFIDAEHALDPIYARALGVKMDELLISQPDSGEQALSVVETLVGHGIGQQLHEDPQVPNYRCYTMPDPILEEGLVIAIEPMINVGTKRVVTLADGWTVVTADRKLSAHFEHTVAVTAEGPRVLTDRPRRTSQGAP